MKYRYGQRHFWCMTHYWWKIKAWHILLHDMGLLRYIMLNNKKTSLQSVCHFPEGCTTLHKMLTSTNMIVLYLLYLNFNYISSYLSEISIGRVNYYYVSWFSTIYMCVWETNSQKKVYVSFLVRSYETTHSKIK